MSYIDYRMIRWSMVMIKTARWILRVLNWLNWGLGVPVVIAGIFVGWFGSEQLIGVLRDAGRRSPEDLLQFVRVIFILTAPMIVLAHIAFTRLIAIIDTLAANTVFSTDNADRLRHIAWALLGTQIIDVTAGIYAQVVSERSGEYLGWSFGLTGWLAALMLFILARIFRDGAVMREELEGTV
jgi:hypothetical protein